MSEIKWIAREFEHATEFGDLERDSIVRHCIWSQPVEQLRTWFADTPSDDLVIHIAGIEATPVVLEVHPDGPIRIADGPSVRDVLQLSAEHCELSFRVEKTDAMQILNEGRSTSKEKMRSISETYADVLRSRINGKPFVHLTIGTRALPIDVPYEID